MTDCVTVCVLCVDIFRMTCVFLLLLGCGIVKVLRMRTYAIRTRTRGAASELRARRLHCTILYFALFQF